MQLVNETIQLSEVVLEFPEFYAVRPDWLEAGEKEAFQSAYPGLVAKYPECWQEEKKEEE